MPPPRMRERAATVRRSIDALRLLALDLTAEAAAAGDDGDAVRSLLDQMEGAICDASAELESLCSAPVEREQAAG